MNGWVAAHIGLIYQVYGLAFLVLGVVAYVLPRQDAMLRFAPHLWLLALFGVLHGALEFVESERLHNPAGWLLWLGSVLLPASYAALLEFGRRVMAGIPGSVRLSIPLVHGAAGIGVAALTLYASEPLSGWAAGSRYFIGAPGALLTGLALFATLRAQPERFAGGQLAVWLRVVALGFIAYAVLTLFPSAAIAGFPAWLPTQADFLALSGVPVQLARALCAAVSTFAFIALVRQVGAINSDDLLRVVSTLNGFVYRCNNNRDRAFAYLTGGIEALCGYPADDFLRRRTQTWGALIHPEDAGRARDDIQAALAARRDFDLSYRIRARDGEVRWVLERGRGIFDAKGSMRFLEGHIVDATGIKRAEAALKTLNEELEQRVERRTAQLAERERVLRRSEERLNQAQQVAHVGSFDWENPVSGPLEWSDEHFRLWGLAPRAATPDGALFRQGIHPDDVARVEEMLRQALHERQRYDCTYRVWWPDGSEHHIHARGEVTFDDAGRATRMIGTVHDVTERHETHNRLRELTSRRESVREEERASIARELHDELGQVLTGMKLELSALRKRYAEQNKDMDDRITSVSNHLDRAIGVTRHVVTALRPPALDFGIVTAIEWVAGEFTSHSGIECVLDLPEEVPKIPGQQAIAVFRIVQECLTNVTRHAAASRVGISLKVAQGRIKLRVTDNGRGFEAAVTRGKRTFGLMGIRERAAMLGGTARFVGTPGKGTEVIVDFSAGDAS